MSRKPWRTSHPGLPVDQGDPLCHVTGKSHELRTETTVCGPDSSGFGRVGERKCAWSGFDRKRMNE